LLEFSANRRRGRSRVGTGGISKVHWFRFSHPSDGKGRFKEIFVLLITTTRNTKGERRTSNAVKSEEEEISKTKQKEEEKI